MKFVAVLKDQKTSIEKQGIENGTEAKFSELISKGLPPARAVPISE